MSLGNLHYDELWNFRSQKLSLPGAKASWNFRSREQKSCGTFALSEKLLGVLPLERAFVTSYLGPPTRFRDGMTNYHSGATTGLN